MKGQKKMDSANILRDAECLPNPSVPEAGTEFLLPIILYWLILKPFLGLVSFKKVSKDLQNYKVMAKAWPRSVRSNVQIFIPIRKK